ncbi:hypothetical protein SL053_002191 [Flavobacterium psychrophilum]|nr:hypothetical protein [Flavobacterium psychrophilum]ELY2018272.1 hypothetical protein [Flavobacterium psychrophilum]
MDNKLLRGRETIAEHRQISNYTSQSGEGGAPLKGVKWLNKMVGKYGPETIATVEKVGSKYYKYSAEVAGRNGRTIYTKYLNMEGKTMKFFHDSYNSSNKFMHRGWTEGSTKVHQWWNGVKQYGQHYFPNR